MGLNSGSHLSFSILMCEIEIELSMREGILHISEKYFNDAGAIPIPRWTASIPRVSYNPEIEPGTSLSNTHSSNSWTINKPMYRIVIFRHKDS